MAAELKDIALVIDGEDPLADAVQAGVALLISHNHGARIAVFEQSPALDLDHLEWGADDAVDDPYAFVEVCGLRRRDHTGRSYERPAMRELLREAHEAGDWHKNRPAAELVESLRCADLVIVGSPVTLENASVEVDDIVMRAGRPVLVIPRRFAQRHPDNRKMGHRVLIAWNASAPCARAVHDALPFLRLAQEVTLLFVNAHRSQAGAHRLVSSMASHLALHGVVVRAEVSPAGGLDPSRIIRDRLDELDINLMVMGAFSRSRLSERWFGGASEELLHDGSVPIFTSH